MFGVLLGFGIGALLGSLILCLASRSLTNESFFGRSYCLHCKHKLAWYDLFPVLSYLSLSGKCRYCKKKLGFEYPLVELFVGLLIGLLFFRNLPTSGLDLLNFLTNLNLSGILKLADLAFESFIICVLVAVFLTDIKTGLIPNRITYPAIVIAFFYLLVTSAIKVFYFYQSLQASVLGKYLLGPESDYLLRHALINSSPLWGGVLGALALFIFFGLIIVLTRGRGMGVGDLKLGVFMGLVLGFERAIFALMFAFISGSIIGISLIIFGKKKMSHTIPFGPFLTLGTLVALIFGTDILNWYFSLSL